MAALPSPQTVRCPVVVILISALLATAAGAHADVLERPALTVGDYWTYDTVSTVTAGVLLRGTLTSRVADLETASIAGTPQEVYRVILNGTGTARVTFGSTRVSARWTLTGEDLLESSQLKVVEGLLGLSIAGTSPAPFTIEVQNATTYRILDDGWRFPLSSGATGSVRMDYNFSQTIYSSFFNTTTAAGNGTWTLGYAMDALTAVSVPAGTFESYPINETWPDGGVVRAYFAASVGNDVRTENYNDTGVLTSTTNLTAYRYQAAEPPTFLGLTAIQWIVIAAAVAIGTLGMVIHLRRRRRTAPPPGLPPAG